ncbi:MAG: transposase, partial [Planctomycetota bacterium]
MARNFQVFDPLDFIAELTQHIPDPRKHLVRYFGFYSNKSRGLRAKANGDPPHGAQAAPTPSAARARRRGAALIRQVWKVDPLVCPRCGRRMKIVSFIQPTQRNVIDKILTPCGLGQQPSRAP